jgi:hypothetical protein
MKFFAPDWDDRVDPGFDFITERPTLGRDPYRHDVYAHELIRDRIYDGVLVSRMSLGESGKKREAVDRTGMKAYLRLPANMELFGDCGAYGYVGDTDPRFDTEDVIQYYSRLGFDYGVSVDHLIVPEFESQAKYRFRLTLRNAREFIRRCRRGLHPFVPVGAVQGWDVASYVEAAKAVVGMDYRYIAIGGLARSTTKAISEVIRAVREAIPREVSIHVFGVGRLSLLSFFIEQNITSVDSAAPIRQAWLSASENYYTLGSTYAAIRIPVADEERSKKWTLVGRSDASWTHLKEAEERALASVRAFDKGNRGLEATLSDVIEYDKLLAGRKTARASERRWELYKATLNDRPWRLCRCPICKEIGVEVVIFRGNNRNRRRGFHNLWMVRERMNRLRARDAETGVGSPETRRGQLPSSRGQMPWPARQP